MQSRHNLRNERGQTMVEFALVLPILALFLFGAIQFGIIYNNWVALTDAVRAGARKGAVSRLEKYPDQVAEQQVIDAATDLDTDKLWVDARAVPSWAHGNAVVVEARYPYKLELFGFDVKEGELTTTVTERIE